MSVREAVVLALLAGGTAVVLLSCLAMAVVRHEFARLHYVGPASSVGAGLVAAAVVADAGPLSTTAFTVLFVFLVLAVGGPVLTHATGRAARIRRYGELDVEPGDRRAG